MAGLRDRKQNAQGSKGEEQVFPPPALQPPSPTPSSHTFPPFSPPLHFSIKATGDAHRSAGTECTAEKLHAAAHQQNVMRTLLSKRKKDPIPELKPIQRHDISMISETPLSKPQDTELVRSDIKEAGRQPSA